MTVADRCCSFFELLRYRRARTVVLGGMAGVVAIDTATDGDFSVPVGTGKVQPKTDLVNPCCENIFKDAVERVVTLTAP